MIKYKTVANYRTAKQNAHIVKTLYELPKNTLKLAKITDV